MAHLTEAWARTPTAGAVRPAARSSTGRGSADPGVAERAALSALSSNGNRSISPGSGASSRNAEPGMSGVYATSTLPIPADARVPLQLSAGHVVEFALKVKDWLAAPLSLHCWAWPPQTEGAAEHGVRAGRGSDLNAARSAALDLAAPGVILVSRQPACGKAIRRVGGRSAGRAADDAQRSPRAAGARAPVHLYRDGRDVATPPMAVVPDIMERALRPARSSCTDGAVLLMPTPRSWCSGGAQLRLVKVRQVRQLVRRFDHHAVAAAGLRPAADSPATRRPRSRATWRCGPANPPFGSYTVTRTASSARPTPEFGSLAVPDSRTTQALGRAGSGMASRRWPAAVLNVTVGFVLSMRTVRAADVAPVDLTRSVASR